MHAMYGSVCVRASSPGRPRLVLAPSLSSGCGLCLSAGCRWCLSSSPCGLFIPRLSLLGFWHRVQGVLHSFAYTCSPCAGACCCSSGFKSRCRAACDCTHADIQVFGAGRAKVCVGGRPASRPGLHRWHWPPSCTLLHLLLAVFCILCLRHRQAAAATSCGPKSVRTHNLEVRLCVCVGRVVGSLVCCSCSANRCRPCCSTGLLLAS